MIVAEARPRRSHWPPAPIRPRNASTCRICRFLPQAHHSFTKIAALRVYVRAGATKGGYVREQALADVPQTPPCSPSSYFVSLGPRTLEACGENVWNAAQLASAPTWPHTACAAHRGRSRRRESHAG